MHHLVPDFILDKLGRKQYRGHFPAVCLFVDTSGFTPLTNTLMAQGAEGAEAIADALTTVIGPLVQIIYEQGGFVAGFAGDAFKAIFPKDEGRRMKAEGRPSVSSFTLCTAYLQAVAAAWRIRQHMAQEEPFSTRFGDFDFAVKVTIGDGVVEWGIWRGDAATATQNAVYYVEGEALARCLEADPFAGAGDVIMTQAVYEQLPADAVATSQAGAFRQLTGVSDGLPAACPPRPLGETAVDESLARAFFPVDLLHLPIRGEFRQVVSVFINLQSLPAGELFPRTLFRLLNQYGGYLCRAGRIGDRDKGGTLLLFWGAPYGRENDVDRALHFVLDLQAAVTTPLKAGITTGMAYAGFIGSLHREEYTCHGVYVNLAARQMVAAGWNEIWLDEESAGRAERAFDVAAKGGHPFKGFAEMRPVFLLRGRREVRGDSFYRGRLAGREQEVAQLEAAVRPLGEGRFGGVLTVSGEAGIGKSRLVHEFLAQLQTPGFSEKPGFSVFLCQSDEILRQSLNPFRYFLRRYFDQSSGASEAANKQRFDRKVNDLIAGIDDAELQAEVERTRSFLGALVDLQWPGSLYAQLEPKLRFENTLAALKALIRAESRRRPVIVHLEDAHWLDADSRAFLTSLTRNVADYPFLVIATTRPSRTEGAVSTLTLPEEAPQISIELGPLSPAALEALAAARLEGPVAKELADLLVERAEGNPFFAEQILLYLQEQGLISRNGHGWELKNGSRPNGSLPADVRSLLVARLDRLPADVRQVVQAASVLGREFAIEVLAQMLSEDKALIDKVKAAAAAAIWAALGDVRYLFRHTLLRDAAYEMQLQAQRRRLHRLAAAAVEVLYADDLSPYYGELAYHAEQAGLVEKARHYLRNAGDAAREAYQNSQAIDYYNRALALTTENRERYYLLLALEKVYYLQGAREAQSQELALLESLAEVLDDERRQAEVALRQARFAEVTGNYAAALTAAQIAIGLARASQAADLEAMAYWEHGRALWRQGDFETAHAHFERALILAQTGGLRQLEADSLRNLGIVSEERGDFTAAGEYYELTLRLYRELGDRVGEGDTLNNLGNVANSQGNPAAALAYYKHALQIFLETGDRLGERVVRDNIGIALQHQGDVMQARAYHEEALRLCHEIGDRQGEGNVLYRLGNALRKQGDCLKAVAFLKRSVSICRETGSKLDEGYALTNLGEALLGLGRLPDAAAAFQQAVSLREELKQFYLAVESRAGLARVALAQGNLSQAQAHVELILHHLKTGALEGAEEPFLIYLTCYRVLCANRDARAQDILHSAYTLLQERAARIPDESVRRSFLENIPAHGQLMAEWEQRHSVRADSPGLS